MIVADTVVHCTNLLLQDWVPHSPSGWQLKVKSLPGTYLSQRKLPRPRLSPFLDATCIAWLTNNGGTKTWFLYLNSEGPPQRDLFCDPITSPSDQSCCLYFSQLFFPRAPLLGCFRHSNLSWQNANSTSALLLFSEAKMFEYVIWNRKMSLYIANLSYWLILSLII